ncbi:Inner membrane protein ypdA [Chlamydia abortus]|uniref:cache domain-containing sensor histidine kinase n=1 Tax=Paenibacillus sp. SAFN-117 TaxID=3436860 RepID=UPI000A27ACFF|nr:sensor histidine kinase [Aneurinibacillus sp. XH2]SHE13819.1 Inner membrane protein ypdA [Chlamydia abortus]
MRRLLRGIYNYFTGRIQVRLTCYFLLILLPLVIISLFANGKSQQILEEETGERTRGALQAAVEYIDLTLQNVDELSTLLATDRNLIRLLEEAESQLTPQSIVDFSLLMREITNVMSINHILSKISIIHLPSEMMITTDSGGKRIPGAERHPVIAKTVEANGARLLYIPEADGNEDLLNGTFETDQIYLLRTMDLYNHDRQPNILILAIKRDTLLKLTSSIQPSENAHIYLFSNDNKLVAGTGHSRFFPYWDPVSEEMVMKSMEKHEENMFIIRAKSRYSNWSLQLMQPEVELNGKTRQLQMFTYLIIGLSVILALWISWIVFSGISSPLSNLAYGLRQLRFGNLDVRLSDNNRKDEFGYVTNTFNKMIEDQKHLIENHYEQQLRLSRTELKFLQSQINPHFLYNTLDTIYWTAKNYEASEISEMVLNLSRFFRLSLNKGKDTFTVEETMGHLNYYIRVQQLRFLDQFTVEYEISEDSKHLYILKLLLQPLVENAILHGLEKKQSGGHLRIVSRLEDDHLQLTVQDNGVGISAEKLRYIRQELAAAASVVSSAHSAEPVEDLFGLRNVVSRIKLYYGSEARLSIDSQEEVGTTVLLSIPMSDRLTTGNGG